MCIARTKNVLDISFLETRIRKSIKRKRLTFILFSLLVCIDYISSMNYIIEILNRVDTININCCT
jgi:hypothetical protein